jgi:branched-chain amino acid aminotransferase
VDLASLDGLIGPADEALIPVTDEGFLRGDGAFEVMRLYDGTPFALDDHLRRLATSAGNLRLEIDLGALRADVEALLAEAPPEARDGALRVIVTRGGRRLALTEPLPAAADSIRLATVTFAPTRILDGVKSLSYAANMLASRVAREQGADEALLVTPHGRVLEAPTSSFFWVAGGEILTPPLDDHILASITRARVIEETGASERACTLEDALAADEAFLASTTREVQPVASVDGRVLPAVPGPLTGQAAAALRARIKSELAPIS